MSFKGPRPVVALNKDAKVVGSFPSVSSLARYMGVKRQNIVTCIQEMRPYKRMLIMYEEDFREKWLYGDVNDLKFGSETERRRSSALRSWSSRTKEQLEKHSLQSQETARKQYDNNPAHPFHLYQKLRSHMVQCMETGECYDSINQAAHAINVHPNSLWKQVKRGRPCKGYTFIKVSSQKNEQHEE